MKIKMSSHSLFTALISIVLIIQNLYLIKILYKNKSLLKSLLPMFIVIIATSLFKIIYCYSQYKDFLTIEEDSIVINYVFKKKVLNLFDIKNVEYDRNNLTFYMNDETRKRISLAYVSKTDKLSLYEFFNRKSIKIVM